MTDNAPKSSPLLIALAWLFVIVPAVWGIHLTAVRALALFR